MNVYFYIKTSQSNLWKNNPKLFYGSSLFFKICTQNSENEQSKLFYFNPH